MRRVLMVFDALNVGGTETHVLALTKELLTRGYTVVVCAQTGKLSSAFAELGCCMYPLEFPSESEDDKSKAKQALAHIMRTEQIDVVHVHQIPSGLLASEVAGALQIPLVLTVHGTCYENEGVLQIARRSDEVISVSPPVFGYLQHRQVASTLIPNGIDVQRFQRTRGRGGRRRLGIPDRAAVVLYASRLSWEKASVCKRVVKACHSLRERGFANIHLIVAGDGFQARDVRRYARKLEHKSHSRFVHFLGEQMDMCALYSMSDCVVGTGRVTLEAMSCRCPVVAVGTSGFFGVLAPARLDEAWIHYFGDHTAPYPLSSSRIRHSLQNVLSSHRRAVWYGDFGRKYVKKHFRIDVVTTQVMDVYEQAIKEWI